MKTKKIVSIILVLITIVTTMGILQNNSNAATFIVEEADLYSKGELVCLRYKGNIVVGVEFVVYKKDGVEYPAYCLNRNLPGVTEDVEYTVKIDGLVTDNKIWRAVTNGYPYKTAKELGCNSDIEAFAATKMAVYDMMYNYNWDDFEGMDEQGERVLNAAISISKAARNSSSTKPVTVLEIKTDNDNWAEDNIENGYISKTYYVENNVESTGYTVKLNNVKIENVRVTDENNNEKNEFKIGEKFKILVPVSELDLEDEFEIEVLADAKTKPILYGKSPDSSMQSYALAGGDYEFENAKLTVRYFQNVTCIKIQKMDEETKEPLKDAKFNVLDENKNIVYSDVTTNEEGIAVIENVVPGKYYIQEVKSPDGYTKYDGLVEIYVGYNQEHQFILSNYKKPQDEEKQVEDEKTEVTGEKEVNLPRTGF